MRIVVVEDEVKIREGIARLIESQTGHVVLGEAVDGREGLEMILRFKPDLVITDIRMPNMDGLEMAKRLYEQKLPLHVVILSGYSEFEYAQKAIQFHVDNYLLKPIDQEELCEALQKIRIKLDLESEKYRDVFQDTSASPRQIAETLHEYIIRNYDKEINLNSIAHNLNYSSSYLTKIFNQYYQTTPGKYIISIRIQNASQLLLHHPELSIGQIGDMVGYPEQGYFSRIFKKQTGLSPFEYRENKGRLPEALPQDTTNS